MNKKSILCIFLLLGMVRLAFAGPRMPTWLLGRSPDYPDSDYIVYVGEGETLDEAKKMARKDLSEMVETRIEQVYREKKKEVTAKDIVKKAILLKRDEVQTEKSVKTYFDAIIERLKIADTWFNGSTNRYFAFAVVEKQKESVALSSQILAAETMTANYMDASKNVNSATEKVHMISLAIEALIEREDLIKKKRVLDPDYAIKKLEKFSLDALKRAKDDYMQKIVFSVKWEGAENDFGITDKVIEKFIKEGYRVKHSGKTQADAASNAVISIVADINQIQKEGLSVAPVYWKATINMTDTKSNQRSLCFSAPEGQVLDKNTKVAFDAAKDTAGKVIPMVAEKIVRDYLNGRK